MLNSGSKPQVRLPHVRTIGFSGHRRLNDETAARTWVREFLKAEQGAAGDLQLYGVSSAAAGADLLFAEECLDLGIPLQILLPLQVKDFREDFDDADWARAQHVMAQAVACEVIGTDESRQERYYACGIETVERSQLLLALWNGEPAKGPGGTAEIIEFAECTGRPVVWLQSVTGELVRRNPQQHARLGEDPELDFLNRLADGAVCVNGCEGRHLAEAWLAKLDENAMHTAPDVRRLAALPILCTGLAAFVTAGGQRMHAASVWLGVGAGIGLIASVSPALLKLPQRQALWVRIRTAAEVSRSALALWDTPLGETLTGPEILPELAGMQRALALLKAQDRHKHTVKVEAFKTDYLATRLCDQKEYFHRQSKKSAKQGRKYKSVAKLCVVFAIVLSVGTFAGKLIFGSTFLSNSERWFALTASALFQLAAFASAMVVVNDCNRRQRRYDELYRLLSRWEVEMRVFYTWHPVMQVVERVERALLVELLEWRSLLQNMKMPRN